jgi:pSer/pThr/pTyr-binding forkhead associated (FHA) protein
MPKLIARHHGKEIANLTLESGQEYVAGRDADCAIRLEAERGVSRHHLKFVEREGRWVVECLSNFLLIQRGGERLEILELTEATVFSLPPFEFSFEPPREIAAAPAPAPGENLPTFYIPRVKPAAPDVGDATQPRANNEATVAAVAGVSLVPFLRIAYPEGGEDILKLEGQQWTAGRESACEITVNSAHMSRRHFEITRSGAGYFITDLGSSNGTKLNTEKLPAHEPKRLESGDEICVQNIVMTFEIRDPQFTNKLGNLPVPAVDPMLAGALVPWGGNSVDVAATQYAPLPPQGGLGKLKGFDWKKNKIRVVLGLLAPVLIIGLLMPEEKKPAPDPDKNNKVPAWDGLSPEKKNIVKDSFALARNLYVQGKYALCQTELRKVHDLVPQFENSKELEQFCDQGLELVRRQEDLDRQAREKAAIEAKISGYVEDCKGKLSATSTVDETRVCLAAAIEMAPEHPFVVEMLHTAQMHEEERKFLKNQQAAEQAKVARGNAVFAKAEAVVKNGDLLKTIAALRHYLTTNFPGDGEHKSRARRELAAAESELAAKIGGFLQQCKAFAEKGQMKDAFYACDKAVAEDKSNKEAIETRDKMKAKLHKDMRPIYEDSVLEENMGNVDTAKEKWKKIVSDDVEADDYFTKAKSKLNKYQGD